MNILCPKCQSSSEGWKICPACGYEFLPVGSFPSHPPARDIGDDAGMRMLLPVGRSPLAIAAGYLGLFAMIPFFAPFAILTGVLAIWQIRRNPKLHGMGRAIFGVVLGTISVIAWGLFGVSLFWG